ncbi:MAG: hypothetical protein DI562_01785 [Stenotrophomonas acidaminiphila]|nr:MAG: hypothetical protein DI562_01785 [Stenotrophomonas acidaminiphila]
MLWGTALAPEAIAGPWEVGGTGVDRKRKLKAEVALRESPDSRVWARPVLGYALPYSDALSFEVAHGYGVVEQEGGRRSGVRDLDVKLKYQLARETPEQLAWLIEPKLSVPVGDERSGIGRGRYALELPLRASRTVDALTYTAEARYTHVFGAERAQQLWGVGGLIEYVPAPTWVVGIDLFADTVLNDAGRYHLRSNVAGKWRPSDTFEVQALVGRSVSNRRGPEQTSYKLVFEYKY